MTETNDRSSELDPQLRRCPFCGLSADFTLVEDGYPAAGWTVECEQVYTDDGGSVPRIQCFGYRSQHAWPTKAQAAVAWNKRAFE